MYAGLLKPKRIPILGQELAGEVVEVGNKVTTYRKGDQVFGTTGFRFGAYAEYICLPENPQDAQGVLAPKPANLTFEEAATVPTAAFEALHFLRSANIQPGSKVLIIGGGGSIGTFAIQLARYFGAEVTGVDSTAKLDLMQSLGADHVIDYTREDFTLGGPRYDLILDNVANHPLSACRRALTPGGTLLPNSGNAGMSYVIKAFAASLFARGQGRPFVSTPKTEDLVTLKELIESGNVTPVVDRTYPLPDTPEAFRHLGEGHARGKVVISVERPGA